MHALCRASLPVLPAVLVCLMLPILIQKINPFLPELMGR